jgi:hypothetical protein
MDWEKVLSKISSDGHLPIGFIVFAVGAAIHVYHGLDASFVAFTTTVLAFLGGHAYVQGQNTTPPEPPK